MSSLPTHKFRVWIPNNSIGHAVQQTLEQKGYKWAEENKIPYEPSLSTWWLCVTPYSKILTWCPSISKIETWPEYGYQEICREIVKDDPVKIPQSSNVSNPKDSVGTRKWRQFCTVPFTVMWEVGVAMLEGALKYGRHNYRDSGIRATVYIDAAMGHLSQWWEGEDIDPDSKLSHITKAITSLVVLRDAMLQEQFIDDRPYKSNVSKIRDELQTRVEELLDKYPNPAAPFIENNRKVDVCFGYAESAGLVSALSALNEGEKNDNSRN